MTKIFTPREWQNPIITHMTDLTIRRVGIFAGMGLGKTVAALTAIDILILAGDLTTPVLVLAPLRVATNTWPAEVRKWDHLRHIEIQPVTGGRVSRTAAIGNKNAAIFTMNYENLPWLIDYFDLGKVKWPFKMVVCDESTRLKGFRTRQGGSRAKALGRIIHKHVDRVCLLTGTPSPNGLKDLWGQLWMLDGGKRLGRSYSAFERRWFGYRRASDAFSRKPSIQPIIQPYAQVQIETAVKDICLSVDIRDYVDIREPIVNTIYVDLPPKARKLYDDMERKMFIEIKEHEVEAFGAAAKTMKCLQLANGAVYVGEGNKQWEEVHDAKIQALDSIINEAAGAPVLVAYHFKSDLARLQKCFPGGRELDSQPDTLQHWNLGEIPVLFAHPASAGHGLNLQDGGNILVFFGHNWNLEEFMQMIERIGPTRQMQSGHDRPVFVHHIVARDTIDEIVMARRESKREVQDLLIEACKRRILA